MQVDIEKLILVLKKCAHDAGKQLLQEFGNQQEIILDDKSDIKLKADVQAETLIRKILTEETKFPIVGEEKGGDESLVKSNEYYWVVDPLDGTFNYYREIPHCCVSIGLMRGLEPILGIIYDFNQKETYIGSANGLFLNDKKISKPAWASSKEKACIIVNFPHGRDFKGRDLSRLLVGLRDFKKIRINGSAALGLAYVAAGRADAFWAKGIRLWDIAAGLALLKAVGATVRITPVHSKPFGITIWASAQENWSWPL